MLGLEHFTPANPHGSSHGHSRIFRHAYFEHPDYVPLLRHATARLESLERESGTPLLHRCGMLLMGAPGCMAVTGAIESAQHWGLPLDALDAAAVRSRFPWFDVPSDTHAAFEANAGSCGASALVYRSFSHFPCRSAIDSGR